ncbi:MAG: hypothetical protein MUF21_06350 [Gemmatimonadaceae bacterium]|nr:hypothetical protein [Gemmatimonadaceae bacterium]
MPPSSPYRTLPVERRVALVHHLVRADRAAHATFVSRIVAKGGGFRAVAVANRRTSSTCCRRSTSTSSRRSRSTS